MIFFDAAKRVNTDTIVYERLAILLTCHCDTIIYTINATINGTIQIHIQTLTHKSAPYRKKPSFSI